MKILATKQPLAPLPNIRVGYMKHYFFCAFLSLLLASCGGGSGGSSSSSSKKGAKECKTPIANGKGGRLWNKATKEYSTTCTVTSCDAGYDNDANQAQCGKTPTGFYSLAKDKTRKTCPTRKPDHSLVNTTTGLKLETDCWKCESGSLKNTKQKKCTLPTKGKYYNAQGSLKSCDSVGGTNGGFLKFLDNRKGVNSATGCNFSCKSNHVKSVSNYTCKEGETCPIASGVGFQQTSSAPCQVVDCDAGFVKNMGADSCDIPDTGKYADSKGAEATCTPIGGVNGVSQFTKSTVGVTSATSCPFSCNTGYVKSGRSCNFPSSGNYVTAGNTESPCNSITTEGTAVATRIVGAASTATTCPFSCTAGYVVDTSTPKCKYPTQGTYADAQGAEVSCTDISGITGFGSWLDGAATDEDSCPFSCASGYTISGRTCRQPEMLALGQDTSHVLFDNGEVEAWGKVSNRKWRTHLKEDLGSHTPQALVSGDNHQCIILENSGQNHGSLMCWGQNGNDRLGVGNSNPRTTPTAVTASILGDAGGGVPNTVKSVAAGGAHTCAILNDDTVKCWGNNSNGQIGGGSGAINTISGSAGDPLNGGTASRISAGWLHTCAVLSDKSVQCWGNNAWGQTGGGTPNLGGSRTATEISVGFITSCAILNDAAVKCWGFVFSPNLGGKTATQVTVGARHACALLNDKTVKCWGRNSQGQIGGGGAGSDRVLRGTWGNPLSGQTAIEIAARSYHSCAIMESDHSVKCWGKNIDYNDTGFYGQIVGEVAMTGGTNGTGTSTGETATLTTASTPTATALEADANGKVCGLALASGAILMNKDYNSGGSATISAVIDSMIAAIGSPVTMGGTNITLTRKGTNKIEATVNSAVFEGMTLTIYHDDNGGDCTTTQVGTNIPITGGSGAAIATGLWIISEDYASWLGDKTINLDSVHIDLRNAPLTKELIADEIITKVTGGSWSGKQYKDLPYTATKLDGASSTTDDCPNADFCVVFNRVLKGTEGNYGIPFGDRDYGGAVLMTGGSDGTGTSSGETNTLTAASTPTATALETDASGQICKITLSGGTLGSPWIAKNYTTPLTYNGGGSTAITDAIDNLITAISPPVNIAGTNVTLSKTGTDKIAATTNTAVFEGMTLTIFHDDDGEDCTTSPVATEISLSGASGAAQAEGLWVISHDFISGSGDKTINLDSVDIDLGNTDLSKEDIADKIVGEVTGGSWAGTQYEDLPYTATKVDSSDNSDCPSSDYCVEFTRVFAGSEGNDGIPLGDRDYSH